MKRHEWREQTPEGLRRKVRATRHGPHWKVESATEPEWEWQVHDPPLKDDLEELREVLWRKYQRGRVPYGHVKELDKLLAS
jgi:hypothetical protein